MLCTKLLVVVAIATLDRQKNLAFRIKEHKTGLSKNGTDVSEHFIENPDHRIDCNNVNILAHSDNWRKLLIKTGFPKLLVDRYPLDTVAGLYVPPKCCDISLKQGGPSSSLLRAIFRNCLSLWASAG